MHNYTTIVQRPTKRSVVLSGKRYFLQIPQCVYFIKYVNVWPKNKIGLRYQFDRIHVGFNLNGVKTITKKTMLDLPPFGNAYRHNMQVCMSGSTKYFDTVEAMARLAISKYWSAAFNFGPFDLFENLKNKKEFFQKWDEATRTGCEFNCVRKGSVSVAVMFKFLEHFWENPKVCYIENNEFVKRVLK